MRLQSLTAILATAATGTMVILAGAAPSQKLSEADVKYFESKVRPLLHEHCVSCHGDAKQNGGLRLDTREGFAKGGARGPLLVAGEPEKSRLLQVVRYTDDLKMPPAGKLKEGDLAVLTDWVRRGAPWPETPSVKPIAPTGEMKITAEQRRFWAFQPVKRPAAPAQAPIDALLLEELKAKGLPPAPIADRHTLIRRAAFDLTGLPPSPAEVEAFLADRSPDAFAKVVDRLLASPRYGERWGRHWLDLMRYCDSLDSRSLGAPGDIGEAWRYRDWVIDAFNRDLPYTEFIKDQIAGDLRPSKDPKEFNRAGLVATTMLAIGNWGNGDADKEKIHTDIVDDQIDVISRGFMGLTLACARCHNHKFDPLSQRDYYGLAGIFFSTHILAKFTPKGAGEDIMRTPIASPAELEARKKHAARLAELEQLIKAAQDARRSAVAQSLRPEAGKYLLASWEYQNRPKEQSALTAADFARQKGLREFAVRQWLDFLGFGGFRVMTQPVRDLLGAPGVFAWKGPNDTPSAVINTTGDAKVLLTFTLPPRSVTVHPGPASGVAVAWRSPIGGEVKIGGSVRDADPACGDGVDWKLQVVSAGGARPLGSGAFENSGAQNLILKSPQPIAVRPGDAVQLLVLPKGGHACDTTAVTLTIEELGGTRKWDLAADLQDEPLSANPHKDRLGNAGVWSFLDMGNNGPAAIQGPLAAALDTWREIASKPEAAAAEREAAASRVGSIFDLVDSRSPFWPSAPADLSEFPDPDAARTGQLVTELASLRKQIFPPLEYANAAQDGGIPETPYAGIHDSKVHIRGSYARLGETVPRGFPVILGGGAPAKIAKGSGRLELAEWLASEKHPLTARVMVNRIWQHHFGEGIVRTPSNFGFLGERPTNSKLLDWLASEFVRQGWSIKKMHRVIMLSDAYRRSSTASSLAMRIDPDNRLFGRQNRRRLEAESLRDSLLAVAGKLDTTMGGPAVRDFSNPRRTVYVITVRSDRAGFGPLFDAADTTAPVDRRTISVVAPQALFMLNNSFTVEQSRALAKRLTTQEGEEARIRTAYRLLFSRQPSSREIEIGRRMLASARLKQTAQVAGAPVADFDLKSWEAYCQVLVCSNEFMFVD